MDENVTVIGHDHHDDRNAVDMYVPPILMSIGATCNVLVITVMRMRGFSHVSTSLYICINAVIDNVSLLIPFPAHWLHVNFPEVMHRGQGHDFMCKVFHFLGWSTSNLGISLTAAMTMERAIAIKFPLKAATICTKHKAKHTALALMVLIAIKDGHYLIKSSIVAEDVKAYLCEISADSEGLQVYVETVWPVLHNVFLLVAFVIIILSNVFIIQSIRRNEFAAQFSTHGAVDVSSRTRRSSRMRQLTLMLIFDSASIIICTVPLALLDAIKPTFDDPELGHLVYSVCLYLVYVNRCVNFFLYCLSGARFRQGLRSLCVRRNRPVLSVVDREPVFSVTNREPVTPRSTTSTTTECTSSTQDTAHL